MKILLFSSIAALFCGCAAYEPPPEPSGERISINTYEEINKFYTKIIDDETKKSKSADVFPEIPHVNKTEFDGQQEYYK